MMGSVSVQIFCIANPLALRYYLSIFSIYHILIPLTVIFFFVYVQNHILAFFDIFEDEQFGGDVSPKSDHHSFPTGGHRS